MKIMFSVATSLLLCGTVYAQSVFVGPHNFVRAESDRYMNDLIARNELGSILHQRQPTDLENQTVIRMNLDTLYSSGVFDMDAGAVTISLPEAPDGRYVSAQVLSQDSYTIDIYHEGSHTFNIDDVGTRYAVVIIRIFANSSDADDIAYANELQDLVSTEQDSQGEFIIPDYDTESLNATRLSLLRLGALSRGNLGLFAGKRNEIDPVAQLIVSATGWGALPRSEAAYFGGSPLPGNENKPHELILVDVPVNAFWSVTVYNARGFMVPNAFVGVNALNSANATPREDGSYRIQLGGCSETSVNCIPAPEGWNYVIRAYQPTEAISSGDWQAPTATLTE
ncbi:MAG TPA: hypothetical protein DEF79_01340 [Gammaproteobacteria bacterium]|nr:hypothetical protein [Gammaproteobacteria bacterium]|tara:strand:+ start:1420 stop:2433 length:1014 start_codon:yes stop_codon:yes gene_type:complete